ncbi:MAG TPA: hypothetical protein EYP09_01200 [Anaerolineae bacterium]|nr:hypothetical protein [Anaerolineae bacterium]
MIKFLTDEWIKALCQELNRSEAYAQAAKNWEGDFYFIVEPEGPVKEPVIFYVDLWHGKCREAKLVADEGEKQPAFRMRARLFIMHIQYIHWEAIILIYITTCCAI